MKLIIIGFANGMAQLCWKNSLRGKVHALHGIAHASRGGLEVFVMDEVEFECYVKAGEIAKAVKDYVSEIVRPGVKLINIACKIDEKILELGGEAAFPVNLGLNEIAAHFTPDEDCEEVAEGILKVDIGVAVDGFIADTAISFDLTDNGEFEEMIGLNRKILAAATERIFRGVGVSGCRGVGESKIRVKDVGNAVDLVMRDASRDFSIISGLCGHGLGKNLIHCPPTIPNYANDSDKVLDGMAFAVEPFVTMGNGEIIEGKAGGIYALKGSGAVRDRDARKVLDFIREKYLTRPFCSRWILKCIRNDDLDIREEKLKFALSVLVRSGVISEYPILIEKSRKAVSQMENTFLVANGKVVCTTG